MAETDPNKDVPRLASREEVIEASRRRYAVPRAEVERMIAQQMGYPTPEEHEAQISDRLYLRLQGVGVTERQAKYLLEAYSTERIQQQLDWLQYRGAHNSAAFVVAAIRHNYEAPDGLYSRGGDNRGDAPESNQSATPDHSPSPESIANDQ